MTDDERDLLMGLADDAIGQHGGLSRDDQIRLGELALRAWSEVERSRERILLLLAEAKRLRSIVRGIAALEPLADLMQGGWACWSCGVYTGGAETWSRYERTLTAGDVVLHTHAHDLVAAHLPTCVWLLATTHEPDTELDMDDLVAARALVLLRDVVRIVAAEKADDEVDT